MSSPKTLIFDFDGTIADTLPVYLIALDHIQRSDLRQSLSTKQIAQLRQMPLQKIFGYLKASRRARLRLFWFHIQYMQKVIETAPMWDDMQEVMTTLHKRGYRLLVVSSNYRRNVQAFLLAKNMDTYFEGIYYMRSAAKAKGLRKLIRHHHLDTTKCYYIANDPNDMKAANNANIHGVAVLWSGQSAAAMEAHHPIAFISKPRHLLKLFTA